jgi:RNA polymerase sigma factor for flagellar operon FliA
MEEAAGWAEGAGAELLAQAHQTSALLRELESRLTVPVWSLGADALMVLYEPLCKHLVERLRVRLRVRGASFDDMMGDARAGLLEAVRAFEAERGASFATFAYYRVQGAVVDGLRRGGLLRRSSRRAGALCAANAEIGEALWTAAPQDQHQRLGAIDRSVSHHGVAWILTQEAEERAEESEQARPADKRLAQAQLRQLLAASLAKLPDTEREIIESIWFRGESQAAVSGRLGCSEAWVSRAHGRARERLRKLMEGMRPRDALSAAQAGATLPVG